MSPQEEISSNDLMNRLHVLSTSLQDHYHRLGDLETWKARQEGRTEMSGGIHQDVREIKERFERLDTHLRARVEVIEQRLAVWDAQKDTAGKGIPWALSVVAMIMSIGTGLMAWFGRR